MLQKGRPGLRAVRIKKDDHLDEAKKLHAEVYLDHGYIEAMHVNSKGHMKLNHDPYQAHADYFAVIEKQGSKEAIVATARQIYPKGIKGHASFPTMSKLELEPNVRQAIESLNPAECIEISALAKKKGFTSFASFMLYRAMWQYSLKTHHKIWIMACDARLYGNLKFLFGDALQQIGKKTHYMGSDVVPAILEVDRSLDVFISGAKSLNPTRRLLHREYIRFFLDGLPAKYLRPRQLSELHLNIVDIPSVKESSNEPA